MHASPLALVELFRFQESKPDIVLSTLLQIPCAYALNRYIYELEQHVQGLQTEVAVVEGRELDRGHSHSTTGVTDSPTPTRPERNSQALEPSIAIQTNDVISSPSITEGVGIR